MAGIETDAMLMAQTALIVLLVGELDQHGALSAERVSAFMRECRELMDRAGRAAASGPGPDASGELALAFAAAAPAYSAACEYLAQSIDDLRKAMRDGAAPRLRLLPDPVPAPEKFEGEDGGSELT